MDDTQLATRVTGHGVCRNLQDCARDFLASEVPALTVCPEQAEDMQSLALRSLEHALQPPRWSLPEDDDISRTALHHMTRNMPRHASHAAAITTRGL